MTGRRATPPTRTTKGLRLAPSSTPTPWEAQNRPPTIEEWAHHVAVNAPPLTLDQRARLAEIFASGRRAQRRTPDTRAA